eukprot:snap_masked-scaffold_54-processed-gene-1.71-mRNA-1 protein AED:1.00 eAED:1.00 QI:0/-1/0/0/-1/1/1/0/77
MNSRLITHVASNLRKLQEEEDPEVPESTDFDKEPFGQVLGIVIAFLVAMTVGSLLFLQWLESRNAKKEKELEAGAAN